MDKFLKLVYVAVTAIILIISFVLIIPAYTNLQKKKSDNEDLKKKLDEKQAECLELRQLFSDLDTNPKAVEKVAREKFGLCRRDEVIYIYKAKSGSDLPSPLENK
ncbi:MAG: septum formation initiator family protein [Victivallales bacterium]